MQVLKEPSRQTAVNIKTGLSNNTAQLYTNDYNINPTTTQSINFHKNTIKSSGPTMLQLTHNPVNYSSSQPESTVNAAQQLYSSAKNPITGPKRKGD